MRDRDEGEFFAATLDFEDKDKKESPKQPQIRKINLCAETLPKLKYERKPYKR